MSVHDDVYRENTMSQVAPPGVTERVARILLTFVGTSGQLTAPDLVERTGLPKSTTYRLVNDLVDFGLLERTEGGALMPAMSMFELGQLAGRFRSLRDSAAPVMQQLYGEFHQVVHLGVLDELDVVYLNKIGSRPGSIVPTRTGGRFPAHLTGLGKTMIAFMPDRSIEDLIFRVFAENSEMMLTCDPDSPWEELERIQRYGIGFDSEQAIEGLNCVAAPIFLPGSRGTAALSVTGPVRSFDLRRAANSVALAAASITRALGGRRPVRR